MPDELVARLQARCEAAERALDYTRSIFPWERSGDGSPDVPVLQPRYDAIKAELARQRDVIEGLRAALEPFKSGPPWGKWKAWLVEGASPRTNGLEAARIITGYQVRVDAALAAPAETPPER